jgi:hypothetical protein
MFGNSERLRPWNTRPISLVDSGAAAGGRGIGRAADAGPAAARRFAGHWRDGWLSWLLSCAAFLDHLGVHPLRQTLSFRWFDLGQYVRATRLDAGPLDRHHADDGDVPGAAHFYLQPRLHGARRKFHPLLLFYVALSAPPCWASSSPTACSCSSSAGNWWAFPPTCSSVFGLKTRCGGGGKKSVHHHAHWRHRTPAGNALALFTRSGTLLFL